MKNQLKLPLYSNNFHIQILISEKKELIAHVLKTKNINFMLRL